MQPGLTVDESMVGQKKSHRWSAKLWVLAESDTSYTLSMDLYAGTLFNIF